MPEKETVFSSKVKYKGIFSFKDFYQFCYDWVDGELDMDLQEKKYSEKLIGDAKMMEIRWEAEKELTDYFRFDAKITFIVEDLKKVEVSNGGVKVETNKGVVKLKVEGILVKDYKGKFETSAFNKFLRGIYEKWIIESKVEEFKAEIAEECDELLLQMKAYLDLEGKHE
tara:strand:- start:1975 stop:2481 length:507 start_codon:yes stop_codon:yes gene_type:complete